MRRRLSIPVAPALLLTAVPASGQDAEIRAVRAASPPVLDGVLDEEV